MSLIPLLTLLLTLIVIPTSAEVTSGSAACKELTPAKAAALAMETAQQRGITMAQYEVKGVSFSFVNREWRTFFSLKTSLSDARLPQGLPICVSVDMDDRANVTNFRTCPSIDSQ
jgi:hypothetical protein